MMKLPPQHVAVDVADLLAADADVLLRLFRLWGMVGVQPRLPKPHNTQWGRWKKERTKMMKKLMKRSRLKMHPNSKCHHRCHRCLTSLRLWLLRPSGFNA